MLYKYIFKDDRPKGVSIVLTVHSLLPFSGIFRYGKSSPVLDSSKHSISSKIPPQTCPKGKQINIRQFGYDNYAIFYITTRSEKN